ncbi:MAG: bifunctional UDP-N-acetylglucosamine diphosphorylase/glucosamine-1-phosphate N-acetyltransferase GlmU [Rickettsiales bacterium]|nr:bifunctional UDP-N-acetylglucosamine diphosphorylase/glucosamine-1-phosphate N-acetyltransferase GlmU [Rickettsiales bacterium]
MSFSIVILAAGQSVRMQSKLPKMLHKLASAPIIDWILATVKNLTVKDCVMVIGPKMSILEDHVKEKNVNIKFTVQEKKLGTADAVKIGISELQDSNENVLVLYGDVPFISADTIKKMQGKLEENPKSALVVLGFESQDPRQYGRLVINSKGQLQKIVEYLDCTELEKKITLCNSGIMMVKKKYIEQLLPKIRANNVKKEFYFTDIVGIALEQKLHCEYFTTKEEEVVAINNRSDLAKAELIIQNHLRNKFLSNGVTLVDPKTVYFSMDTVIANDVIIFPNVFIGAGVKIATGVQINSFSHIEEATIEKNSNIGPFARLRPGTKLSENVRIGNFVEIKNSKIAQGSKIRHLSYIGDTEMGSNVNIGAGAITCNYDGLKKHKTIIEDDAFIGSNAALIAPLTIGKGALVAASSAITKNVASYDLAIERSEQQNIKSGAIKIVEKKQKS